LLVKGSEPTGSPVQPDPRKKLFADRNLTTDHCLSTPIEHVGVQPRAMTIAIRSVTSLMRSMDLQHTAWTSGVVVWASSSTSSLGLIPVTVNSKQCIHCTRNPSRFMCNYTNTAKSHAPLQQKTLDMDWSACSEEASLFFQQPLARNQALLKATKVAR
jgi:hypothetical protein